MKIHIISASPRLNSGFSVVAINIAKGLQELGYEISYSGLQTAHNSEWCDNIEILPTQSFHIDDVTNVMLQINKIKPDVVLCVIQMDGDFNDFAKLFPKTYCYTPAEGRNIPSRMTSDLLDIKTNGGIVIAQCQYGKSEMELALAGLTVPCIYHGFDDKIFRPIDVSKKEEMIYCYYKTEMGKINTNPVKLHEMGCYDCRHTIYTRCPNYKEEIINILKFVNETGKWGEFNIPISQLPEVTKGKFVYLYIGQNLGVRKRVERLLKAYSIFVGKSKQLKDRTILRMHCVPMAINGVDLIKIVRELGLNNNVIFSYGTYRSSGWSDDAVGQLHNTSDCFVTASSSEGFCLPVLQSMACGVPVIAPSCSSFIELIGDNSDISKNRGLLANIGEWQMIENGSERALVNENDMALKMKMLYTDNSMREKFSKNCVEWSKNYTWDKIVLEWNDLLKKMK